MLYVSDPMRMTPRLGSGLFVLSLSAGAIANGRPEVYIHDGFYARLGAGPGYVFGASEPDRSGASASVSGFALSSEFAFGGTLAAGLVLGGGSFSMVVPSPKYAADAGPDLDVGTHHVSGVGPFVDYYFDQRNGAHVQAALLLSGVFVQEKGALESASGFGFGAMLGGGYEAWVSHEWSIGPILRVTVYNDALEGSDSGAKATLRMFVPSLLFGATYH